MVSVERGTFRQKLRALARNRAAAASAIFMLALAVCAVLAPVLAPYDPVAIDAEKVLQAPSMEHWFGTDDTGRDVLSRVIWGARISLRVGLIASGISTIAGLLLGLASGYYGGKISFVILRAMDLLLAFPGVLLAIVIVAILGPSLENVMIAVGISAVPAFTRIVHSSALAQKQLDFIYAARQIGSSNGRIVFRHILPNILAPVIVLSTLQVASAIFGAASLSFIGLGAQPPTPEWGAMVSRGRYNLREAMWLSTFPGLAIALAVVAINILGDGLRDALDPRMQVR